MKTDWRPILYNALLLLFLGLLVYGLWSASKWEWYHFVVCIVAAGFVALLGNLDRLESLKAGPAGIEAKTREVVRKAESAITELQMLAEVLVSHMYETLDSGNRWGGITGAEQDILKHKLLDILDRVGVPQERREAIRRSERRWVIIDYANAITEGLPTDTTKNAAWIAAWKPYAGTLDRPPPETLRAMLLPFGPLEPWREQLLADYEHYYRTDQHRRPQIWAARSDWYEWTASKRWPEV